jgi:hypothetical protein
MFNGFKMISFKCISHAREIIFPKNMFGCPLKFNFFKILAINQNIDTQLYMFVKNHHHHMNYFKLDYSIFSFKLFKINVNCKV